MPMNNGIVNLTITVTLQDTGAEQPLTPLFNILADDHATSPGNQSFSCDGLGDNNQELLKDILNKIIASYPTKPIRLCLSGSEIVPDVQSAAVPAGRPLDGVSSRDASRRPRTVSPRDPWSKPRPRKPRRRKPSTSTPQPSTPQPRKPHPRPLTRKSQPRRPQPRPLTRKPQPRKPQPRKALSRRLHPKTPGPKPAAGEERRRSEARLLLGRSSELGGQLFASAVQAEVRTYRRRRDGQALQG